MTCGDQVPRLRQAGFALLVAGIALPFGTPLIGTLVFAGWASAALGFVLLGSHRSLRLASVLGAVVLVALVGIGVFIAPMDESGAWIVLTIGAPAAAAAAFSLLADSRPARAWAAATAALTGLFLFTIYRGWQEDEGWLVYEFLLLGLLLARALWLAATTSRQEAAPGT